MKACYTSGLLRFGATPFSIASFQLVVLSNRVFVPVGGYVLVVVATAAHPASLRGFSVPSPFIDLGHEGTLYQWAPPIWGYSLFSYIISIDCSFELNVCSGWGLCSGCGCYGGTPCITAGF
jgi:hypothetical protein